MAWPPETFLRWKLSGLAARGFDVTLASADVYEPDFELPGVELCVTPRWGEPISALWLRALRDCLRLLARSPARLARLLRAIHDPALASPVRRRLSYWRTPWQALREDLCWLRIFAPLARLRPDVVHFEWESVAVRYLPLLAVWRCPMIMSCHGGLEIYTASPVYAMIADGLPRAFRQATAVQCVSRVERAVALACNLEPDRAVLLPCGVDPDRFSPGGTRSRGERLHIIAVGWLRWMKGYEYAVQAVRELLDRGVPAELEIFGGDPPEAVGEPSERERILHAVADLGLEGRVHLRGHASSETLIERYRTADVLLHSSVSEGLPVVVLEAMSTGLPVVASDCGDVARAVRDGVDGFVVPVRSPAASASALARIWQDPDLARRMGREGRQRVLSSFTLDHQLEAFERLYRAAPTVVR